MELRPGPRHEVVVTCGTVKDEGAVSSVPRTRYGMRKGGIFIPFSNEEVLRTGIYQLVK